jgi:2,3-bisphosphoglycerate-dependent phosphoglycerate mutase
MKIYLFRHGESTDNQAHLFSGWRNPPLSEKGTIDAAELAELLKEKTIKVAFTPQLLRNTQTLNEVLKYHPGVRVVVDDRLRERCYGELQGKAHLELMKKDLPLYEKYHRSYETPPPGGESIAMVEARVKPFFAELLSKMRKERVDVAVCAGNNAMRVLRRFLEDLTVEQMMKMENPYDNYFEYEVN